MLLCPYCHGTAAPLSVLSSVSLIDFFQCGACGKISERPKGATGQLLPLLLEISPPAPPGGRDSVIRRS